MKFKMAVAIALIGLLMVRVEKANAGGCQAKLVGNNYGCSYVCTVGSDTECLDFGSFGVAAPFDMDNVGIDGVGACICSDTGSTKAPKFNSSSSTFVCTIDSFAGAYVGKVSGKHVTGQSVYENGATCLFSCTQGADGC
jgi:hypothetical protein